MGRAIGTKPSAMTKGTTVVAVLAISKAPPAEANMDDPAVLRAKMLEMQVKMQGMQAKLDAAGLS